MAKADRASSTTWRAAVRDLADSCGVQKRNEVRLSCFPRPPHSAAAILSLSSFTLDSPSGRSDPNSSTSGAQRVARRSRKAHSTAPRQATSRPSGTHAARAGLAPTADTRYWTLFKISRTAPVRLLLAFTLASRPAKRASRTRRMRREAAGEEAGGEGAAGSDGGGWAVARAAIVLGEAGEGRAGCMRERVLCGCVISWDGER